MGLRGQLVAAFAVLASIVVGVPAARASLVEALDLETLVTRADDVVLAQVTVAESHYDGHGRIVTDVQMRVERAEKGGRSPGTMVTVRRLGGTVGDIGMRVDGEPTFESGEMVLLFGTRSPEKVLRPVGMSQGAMRVILQNGERWVRSAVSGAALVTKAPNGTLSRAQAAMEQPRKLDDVLRDIRAIVNEK